MLRAAIFVRSHAAKGVGHTGWTFDYGEGTANAGSVENKSGDPISETNRMDFWTVRTPDPVSPMRQWKYDAFKVIEVEQPDPVQAWEIGKWVSYHSFEVFTRNCMDDTYDVLRAFGVAHLPVPSAHWRPNDWFAHVQGTLHQISSGAPYTPQSGQASGPLPLTVGQVITHFPEGQKPPAPLWRSPGHAEWRELQEAMQLSRQLSQPIHLPHR